MELWLGCIMLVFMDDTVLLATAQANMIKEIELLDRFCQSHGMQINLRKTKFFVGGGSQIDEVINLNNFVVEPCERYN